MQKQSDLTYYTIDYPLTKTSFNFIITQNLKDYIIHSESKSIDDVGSKVLVHLHERNVCGISCNCGEDKLIKCDYSKSERILFSKINTTVNGVTYTAMIHGFGEHDDAKNNNKMYKFYFCNSKRMESVTLK